MSGPQGYDPNQAWSSGQQPPGSEEPTSVSGWQQPGSDEPTSVSGWPQPGSDEPTSVSGWPQPGYPPQQYPQGEQYPSAAPQYQRPYSGAEQSAEPTQYGQPEAYQPTQYGQQQYPGGGQEYAPAGQYTPPGAQFGEAPAFGVSETQKSSKGSLAIIGGVIGVLAAIIIAAVLVMGFWKPGFFVTTKLDVNKAQDGVKTVLTDQVNGYGVKNVSEVKCNNGANPTVKKGDTFTCDASIDGQHKKVTVEFQDDSGTYEVGRPKA